MFPDLLWLSFCCLVIFLSFSILFFFSLFYFSFFLFLATKSFSSFSKSSHSVPNCSRVRWAKFSFQITLMSQSNRPIFSAKVGLYCQLSLTWPYCKSMCSHRSLDFSKAYSLKHFASSLSTPISILTIPAIFLIFMYWVLTTLLLVKH